MCAAPHKLPRTFIKASTSSLNDDDGGGRRDDMITQVNNHLVFRVDNSRVLGAPPPSPPPSTRHLAVESPRERMSVRRISPDYATTGVLLEAEPLCDFRSIADARFDVQLPGMLTGWCAGGLSQRFCLSRRRAWNGWWRSTHGDGARM